MIRCKECMLAVRCLCVLISSHAVVPQTIRDLLNPDGANLHVRQQPERGFFVEGMHQLHQQHACMDRHSICTRIMSCSMHISTHTGSTMVDCHDLQDLLAVASEGHRHRQVASHTLNTYSSRSHAIMTVYVETRRRGGRRCDGCASSCGASWRVAVPVSHARCVSSCDLKQI